jgi:hypothetical protein
VLATVGVPPTAAIAPPFTRILPAASRLITIELLLASPKTDSTPELKVAVVAALAAGLAANVAATPRTIPASSLCHADRRPPLLLAFIMFDSPGCRLVGERIAHASKDTEDAWLFPRPFRDFRRFAIAAARR